MIFNFEHGTLPGSLELAYLGDALYDLYVREHLIAHGGRVRSLHRQAVSLVCAHAQSEALKRVEDMLTEAEAEMLYADEGLSDASAKLLNAKEMQFPSAIRPETV